MSAAHTWFDAINLPAEKPIRTVNEVDVAGVSNAWLDAISPPKAVPRIRFDKLTDDQRAAVLVVAQLQAAKIWFDSLDYVAQAAAAGI